MTKGKYANRAAASQARTEAASRVAVLEREVRDLTTRVNDADRENLQQQTHYMDTVAELRARLATATAPRVEELEATLIARDREIRGLQEYAAELQEKQNRVAQFFTNHFAEAHQMPDSERTELLGRVFAPVESASVTVVPDGMPLNAARKLKHEGVVAIRRARRQ